MILVDKKADTLEQGINNMMAGAKDDYVKMSTSNGKKELVGYSKEQVDKWDSLIRVEQGQKFIRVVRENGVFAFIVKEDNGRFKKGDILKPAGYRAPAKNSARGNVLSGNYYIQWTGPLYMDSQRRLRG